MGRLLSLPLLALALLATAAPAEAAKVTRVAVGIADNKPTMFADARFAALRVRRVRTTIPWDVLGDPARLQTLDAFMRGARRRRASVMLTFDRSPRRIRHNPSGREMRAAIRGLRGRYPGQVRDVAAWNEPNINKHPKYVVRWWQGLQRACRTCRVLPGELVDRQNAVSYVRRVEKLAKREARWWGLHNYVDANRFTTGRTRSFLRAVSGEVWLTETGGVVQRRNRSRVKFKAGGPRHARAAVRFVFRRLARLDRRITRVYFYNWDTPGPNLPWDSGFIGPDGEARPALAEIRRFAPKGTSRGTSKTLRKPPGKGKKPKKMQR